MKEKIYTVKLPRLITIKFVEFGYKDSLYYVILHLTDGSTHRIDVVRAYPFHDDLPGKKVMEALAVLEDKCTLTPLSRHEKKELKEEIKDLHIFKEFRNLTILAIFDPFEDKILRFYLPDTYASATEVMCSDSENYGKNYTRTIFPLHPDHIKIKGNL